MSDIKGPPVTQAIDFLDDYREVRTGDPRIQALRERDPLGYLQAQLRRRLQANVPVTVDGDLVLIPRQSNDGPDVSVLVSGHRCTVAIGPWYEDMPSLDMALEYVTRAVDGAMRVRIDTLGGKPWKYTLERLESGSWVEESAVVLPRVTFWKRDVTTRYLQNAKA